MRSQKEAGPFQNFLSHLRTVISVFVLEMIRFLLAVGIGLARLAVSNLKRHRTAQNK